MRKKVLERRKQRLLQKKSDLIARSNASDDVKEVRAINEQLQDIADQLQDVQDELQALIDEENGNGEGSGDGNGKMDGDGGEGRSAVVPQNAQTRNASVVGAFGQNPASPTPKAPEERTAADVLGSMEYRKAFANFVRTDNWDFRDSSAGMVI